MRELGTLKRPLSVLSGNSIQLPTRGGPSDAQNDLEFDAVGIIDCCTGCSSGGDGDGGGGSGGPTTAFSFDAETSEQAAEGAAVATQLATRFGSVMSGLFNALVDGAGAASLGAGLKDNIPIPPICESGTATLDWQRSGLDLSAGDIVTLMLNDCAGSPVSTEPATGTITLTTTEVSGGTPRHRRHHHRDCEPRSLHRAGHYDYGRLCASRQSSKLRPCQPVFRSPGGQRPDHGH